MYLSVITPFQTMTHMLITKSSNLFQLTSSLYPKVGSVILTTTTMNTLPTVFTMEPTGLNTDTTLVAEFAKIMDGHYKLKSVLLSPRQGMV